MTYVLVAVDRGINSGTVRQTTYPANIRVQTTHVCARYPSDDSLKAGARVNGLLLYSP